MIIWTKQQELMHRRIVLEDQAHEGVFIPEAWEDLACEFEEHDLPHGAAYVREKAERIRNTASV